MMMYIRPENESCGTFGFILVQPQPEAGGLSPLPHYRRCMCNGRGSKLITGGVVEEEKKRRQTGSRRNAYHHAIICIGLTCLIMST